MACTRTRLEAAVGVAELLAFGAAEAAAIRAIFQG
jgi:hypothetical protein